MSSRLTLIWPNDSITPGNHVTIWHHGEQNIIPWRHKNGATICCSVLSVFNTLLQPRLSGCAGVLDRAWECCYHANTCQSLNMETKAAAALHPPQICDNVWGTKISPALVSYLNVKGLEELRGRSLTHGDSLSSMATSECGAFNYRIKQQKQTKNNGWNHPLACKTTHCCPE